MVEEPDRAPALLPPVGGPVFCCSADGFLVSLRTEKRRNGMKFTKMHGAGNDYVYVDCFSDKVENPANLAVKVSNRNFGIGSDGLILIMPSEKADVRMRMFNSDGSESEMC